jgi:hypothetical protein
MTRARLLLIGFGTMVSVIATVAPAAAASQPAPRNAAQVVEDLVRAGLPITPTITFTAADDPNHLLGRPNQYTSKTAFSDSRINASTPINQTPGNVSFGGSVEWFKTHAQAVAREHYLQSIGASSPILVNEYDYISGDALLRVSGLLTPAQAAPYESALKSVMAG